MKCALRLHMVAANGENEPPEPMPTPKHPFDDVLDAFTADCDTGVGDVSADDADRLYTESVAEGMLSEQTVESFYSRFLNRGVSIDGRTGEAVLSPPESSAVGAQLRAYRQQRSVTVMQLAQEYAASVRQIELIESSTEPFYPDRLPETARILAAATGMAIARLHSLLQAVRATLQMKSAQGSELLAARKVPLK